MSIRPGSTAAISLMIAAASGSLLAQSRLEIGIRADYPIRGPILYSNFISYSASPGVNIFEGIFESSARHPALGISASVSLGAGMRIRLDPVYQRIGFDWNAYSPVTNRPGDPVYEVASKNGTTANRWLTPVLLERQFLPHFRFGIGPTFSRLTANHTVLEVRNPFLGYEKLSVSPDGGVRTTLFGGSGAAEFPFHIGRFIAAPEVRYNRWTGKHYGGHWAMDEVSAGLAIRL